MKKVLIGVGIFLVVLVGAVVAIPFLFKDKINARVKLEINKQLNAKVDYGDFGLSLIKSFPNFSFSLDDLSVVGVGEFEGDTLAYIPNFNFTIDLMTVIKGEQYKVLALNVSDPVVNAKVNYSGKANWDIVKPSKDATASGGGTTEFSVEIKSVKVEKGNITYDDKKGNMYASVLDLDFEGSGDVTQDIYDLVTKTSIAELTYRSGAVPYLSKAKLDATVNLQVDNKASKYTFKENSIDLNELGLQFDGFVAMPDTSKMDLDVKFKSKKTEFKSILSLIPAVYAKDFDKVKTSGSLDLQGFAKGVMQGENYPAFGLDLKVNNAMFQYPDLPVAVKDINITANVAKPQGNLDLTVVDIPRLHLVAGSDPIDGKINVRTPISDPNVSATVNGKVNLANVPKLVPMEGLKQMSGELALNLNFKGRMSDVDKKNYDAIQASGNAKVTNLVYDSKDVPMPVKVSDMAMTFNPQNITLSNLSAVIGKSDFNANGTLDGFMGYFFGKGNLTGLLNLRSNTLDVNQFLAKDENAAKTTTTSTTAKPDTSKSEYFKVPANIDFTANAQLGKVLFENIVLTNAKGQIIVRDETINLNDIFTNVLGGDATISAKYDTKGKDKPDVTFNYDINNFDFQQTYKTVGMAQNLAPIMKYIQGNFSSDLKGEGKLNSDMSVDYASLKGDGKVEVPNARIVGLPILQKIVEVAKIPGLQTLELKNAFTVLKFKDGKVDVEPANLKFGNGYNVAYQGRNGFDKSIDYDVRFDVPSKELGAATALAQSYLAKVPGLGNAMPETLQFKFKVTGTMEKPIIKLNGVGGGGGSVKDMVNNTIDDAKQKAQEEADKLKKQAEEEFNKQKAEAEKKAKEAVDKAKADAEKRAKEAADKAKKDAEKALKDKFKFPK